LLALAAVLFQLLAPNAVAVVAMTMPVEQLANGLRFFVGPIFTIHFFSYRLMFYVNIFFLDCS